MGVTGRYRGNIEVMGSVGMYRGHYRDIGGILEASGAAGRYRRQQG